MFSGGAKRGDKIRSGYITPDFSWAQKWAELLGNPCVIRGPKHKGENQKWMRVLLGVPKSGEKITSEERLHHPCLLRGPRERNFNVTPTFLRVPIRGDKMKSGSITPGLFGRPKVGGVATYPLCSWGSHGVDTKSKVATCAVSGAQKWAELLRNPCRSQWSQEVGTKSGIAASPLL